MTSRQKDLYTKVFQDLGDQPSDIKPEKVDLIDLDLITGGILSKYCNSKSKF